MNNVTTPLLFLGPNKVIVSNGIGLTIYHVGSSSLLFGSRPLILKSVLHVSRIATNLLNVRKLSADNKVVVEFHANGFVVKDQTTKRALVQGKIDNGLYKLCLLP